VVILSILHNYLRWFVVSPVFANSRKNAANYVIRITEK